MGRKALPKIKLTNDEYDVVTKLIRIVGMGWYYVDRIRCDYDMVYDLSYDKHRTLAFVMKVVNQELTDRLLANNLTKYEQTIWNDIKRKLNIV